MFINNTKTSKTTVLKNIDFEERSLDQNQFNEPKKAISNLRLLKNATNNQINTQKILSIQNKANKGNLIGFFRNVQSDYALVVPKSEVNAINHGFFQGGIEYISGGGVLLISPRFAVCKEEQIDIIVKYILKDIAIKMNYIFENLRACDSTDDKLRFEGSYLNENSCGNFRLTLIKEGDSYIAVFIPCHGLEANFQDYFSRKEKYVKKIVN